MSDFTLPKNQQLIILSSSTCMQVPRFFSRKKTLGLEWGSNPQPHISGVMLYQLSYQAPWEECSEEEGIQVLVLGAHYIKINILLLWNTPGW